jgi:hypothetical protein
MQIQGGREGMKIDMIKQTITVKDETGKNITIKFTKEDLKKLLKGGGQE